MTMKSKALNKHIICHKIILSNFHVIIQLNFPNHTILYQDASSYEYAVGFAIVHNQKTFQHNSIITAIKLANLLQTVNILITSHSLSILIVLKNPWPKIEITQIEIIDIH